MHTRIGNRQSVSSVFCRLKCQGSRKQTTSRLPHRNSGLNFSKFPAMQNDQTTAASAVRPGDVANVLANISDFLSVPAAVATPAGVDTAIQPRLCMRLADPCLPHVRCKSIHATLLTVPLPVVAVKAAVPVTVAVPAAVAIAGDSEGSGLPRALLAHLRRRAMANAVDGSASTLGSMLLGKVRSPPSVFYGIGVHIFLTKSVLNRALPLFSCIF